MEFDIKKFDNDNTDFVNEIIGKITSAGYTLHELSNRDSDTTDLVYAKEFDNGYLVILSNYLGGYINNNNITKDIIVNAEIYNSNNSLVHTEYDCIDNLSTLDNYSNI